MFRKIIKFRILHREKPDMESLIRMMSKLDDILGTVGK